MKLTSDNKTLVKFVTDVISEGRVRISNDIDADFRGNMVQLVSSTGIFPLTKMDMKHLLGLIRQNNMRSFESKITEGGNKIYSKGDGLKIVKTISKKDSSVYKVDKHKSVYDGKKVTMYAIYTKNKSQYSGNNAHSLDMARNSKGEVMYLVPVIEGVLDEAKRFTLPSGIQVELDMFKGIVLKSSKGKVVLGRKELTTFLRAMKKNISGVM